MKSLLLSGLTALLILSGCATPTTDVADTPATINTPTVQQSSRTSKAGTGTPISPSANNTANSPDYPKGTLTPITTDEAASRTVATLDASVDLWQRIRRGFAMPDLDTKLVNDREQWYAQRPDLLANMADRSRKYLFHIVEELERRNLPTELALLPFVESAFNPQAYSSAKAAGMWQFVPATGKQYQLKQNAFRDDRRDVQASTRAALDYFERLYGMFGDWHLALAAYNWGEGSVGRAIAKNKRAGKPTGYLDLNMPNETRYYVPKLLALKNIIARPEAFGVRLPEIENHPYFDTVTITRDIDVTLAAKLAGVSLEDFRELNPSLHRPVILAAGTPQILLPWDNAATFQQNLSAHTSPQLSSWTVWIAPASMKPAEAARRVKMSEADLRSVNRIPPNMIIRAGSTLLIPRPANQQRDVTERIAENGQLALAPEMVLRKLIYKAGKKDSVSTVARRYGLPAAKVAEWNHVNASANFKPGQNIVVYRYMPVRAPAPVQRRVAKR